MKKFLVMAMLFILPACACFDCADDEPEVVTYQTTRNYHQDCDYFDGRTCYRYVYRKVNRPVARPVARRRPCNSCNVNVQERPACDRCRRCDSCEKKVSETREPVEIVYKKTTYHTVCDPKTVEKVTYEKEPYNGYYEDAEVREVVY